MREKLSSFYFLPIFPTTTTEWLVTHLDTAEISRDIPEHDHTIRGFSVVYDFDWEDRRSIVAIAIDSVPGVKPEWIFSGTNSWTMQRLALFFDKAVGRCGDVYLHLDIRHRREEDAPHDTPFYADEIEVRAASGWYRTDTAGRNLVQLARTWSNYGISITGDGETIYYGAINHDSTMAIWAMDKCGGNKRQITFASEDPYPRDFLGVEEEATGSSEQTLLIIPNPANGEGQTVLFTATVAGLYTIEASDAVGSIVVPGFVHLAATPGEQRAPLPLTFIPSGTYVVRITAPGGMSLGSARFTLRQ